MLHPLRGLIEGQLTQGSFKAPRFVTLSPLRQLHTTIFLNESNRVEYEQCLNEKYRYHELPILHPIRRLVSYHGCHATTARAGQS